MFVKDMFASSVMNLGAPRTLRHQTCQMRLPNHQIGGGEAVHSLSTDNDAVNDAKVDNVTRQRLTL